MITKLDKDYQLAMCFLILNIYGCVTSDTVADAEWSLAIDMFTQNKQILLYTKLE